MCTVWVYHTYKFLNCTRPVLDVISHDQKVNIAQCEFTNMMQKRNSIQKYPAGQAIPNVNIALKKMFYTGLTFLHSHFMGSFVAAK